MYTNKQTLRGTVFLCSPECSSEVIWSGWLNSPWMFTMALIPLRSIHLTHLWPRGSISFNVNPASQYRDSVNSRSAVSQNRLETGVHKTVIKCVPLTVSCQPVFKTLVPFTSVNTVRCRSISTNRQLWRESQNSQSSISKTKGNGLVVACLGMYFSK